MKEYARTMFVSEQKILAIDGIVSFNKHKQTQILITCMHILLQTRHISKITTRKSYMVFNNIWIVCSSNILPIQETKQGGATKSA